jgi:hypothetical protein
VEGEKGGEGPGRIASREHRRVVGWWEVRGEGQQGLLKGTCR